MHTRSVSTAQSPAHGRPWLQRSALFASGRDALVGLLRWGVGRHGWRRVWLPSYNCPEVPAALLAAVRDSVELRAYPDALMDAAADLAAIPTAPGDVVLLVNQLGARPAPDIGPARARGVIVVEDHSHDPGSAWAEASGADYAFASLRKTLPIPDGGAVWSPRGLDLPPEPAGGHERARLADALGARRRRLRPDDRLVFRALARAASGSPEPVPGVAISPVSRALLPDMPVGAWRERRRRNLDILADGVAPATGVRVLRAPNGGVAFALTLVFDDAEARAAVRSALISRAVVPLVLWPLHPTRHWGVGPADAELSRRVLSIQGDQRFDADDMHRLAAVLRDVLGG